jgi:hypothetical protein
MVTLKISSCANVTLTLGWITLWGDMGEEALHSEDEVTVKQRNQNLVMGPIYTNWPTDRRSQCNLNLNMCHCTANYRPVLSSERAPYIMDKESNCHSNKCNIWSPAPKGAGHQDELADWPSVVMWLWLRLRNCTVNYRPVLSSEMALQNNEPQLSKRKSQGERKIGCGSQMGAWHQNGLADWLSVVN